MEPKDLVGKRFLAKRKRDHRVMELFGKEYSPSQKCLKVDYFIETLWLVNDQDYEIIEILE